MKIFLLMIFAFLVACGSKPIVTDSIVEKEMITDNLVIFPLRQTGLERSLVSYNFRNHSSKDLITFYLDLDLEDVSSNKDIFVLKDKSESRLTAFSASQGKVLFQKSFGSNRRIGPARISPDGARIVFSWRRKAYSNPVDDELILIDLSSGSTIKISPFKENEVTDLFWGTDGKSIFTAVNGVKVEESPWQRIDVITHRREKSESEPQNFFRPYYSREKYDCDFTLEETFNGLSVPRMVSSIDKVDARGRSPIIEFKSGLERYGHGQNYYLWPLPSCRTALLRVNDVLYVIDLQSRKMAKILTGYAGTADLIPAKILK